MATDEHAPRDAAEFGLEGFRHKPEDEGLSLDRLSGAFAEMLSSGDDPYTSPALPSLPGEADLLIAPPHPRGPAEPDEQRVEISPRTILEAMLFMGSPTNAPLTSRQVAGLMRGVRPDEIDEFVRELNAQYADDGCPYEIIGDGPGYRLVLRGVFRRVRDKFFGRTREVKLSPAAIEVLAVVAYHQPITTEEVNTRRGTNSGAILAQLVRRGLLRLERPEQKPRTPRYFTTDRFLRLFGLANLQELPRSEEDLDRH